MATLNLKTRKSLDELDRPTQAEAGWHKAKITDTDQDDNGTEVLKLTIVGGPSDGCQLTFKMKNPEGCDDEKTSRAAASRMEAIASRLGLITEADLGNPAFQLQFAKAMYKEVVAEVENHAFPDSKTGQMRNGTQLTYLGIYPLDHEKIPDAVRKSMGLPPARKKIQGDSNYSPPAEKASKATKSTAKKPINLDDV